ncbi:BTAD domain-containing putative transcriptional regulator [Streptomyces sp. B93]|uniref:AfsR/SARP family transcriptional regulator n=1 Tax=Streptomyces sp. B93 TaxID=2824875 RepID=UPI001B36D7C6|nr:BTAD domain-containing putative transcriptional regulator [Streptomyces sp. B93]MBQ1091719.1 tetratricopeptide repeat protein [Streptomyces sp. B93]
MEAFDPAAGHPPLQPLRFSVLGPLRAWLGDTELALGSPQQRAVLALLLLRRGRAVSLDDLVDGVWDDDPPPGAVPVLRTYVSRLRRLLEPDRAPGRPSRTVVSLGDGYALGGRDTVASDLDRFEDQVHRAGLRQAAGDHRTAAQLLRAALDLWRGTPLAGVPGPYARSERTRLEARHLHVQEAWLRAELALGRHSAVLPDLVALRDAHPLREDVCELLMLALYRCERQAEALEVYATARRTLVEELGVEPGPSLRALHARVLAGDPATDDLPATDGPPADGEPTDPAPRTPVVYTSQLPADLPTFTGRRAELDRVARLLPAEGCPDTAVVALVDGMAGAGKTTLAVHWAHRVAHRFPDGSLFVNLRGHDREGSLDPADALTVFLVALGTAPDSIPDGLDARAALYRSVLADRRVLIVLDNGRDADQVRPLLPGTAGCLTIVTSRNRLSGLVVGQGAHPFTLGLPTAAEAREMLTRRLGAARVEAEPEAADDIVGLCARLPLTLAVVAARAAHHPEFRLTDIAGELRESHGSLDAFTGGEVGTDVRAVFSWSYRALPEESAGLFRVLSLHPGPDIGTAAASALAGVPRSRARALLAGLTGASLLTERAPGRFVFHDLLRAYAAEIAAAEDTGDRRRQALLRMHDHYLHTAHHAASALDPLRRMLPPPGATTDSAALRFNDRKNATAWLRTERYVLRAVVEHAAAHGFHDHAWRTAYALDVYFNRLGFWQDLKEINTVALEAARAVGDLTGEAYSLCGLGFAHAQLHHVGEALASQERALELFEKSGDLLGQAHTRRALGYRANRTGAYGVALGHYDRARELYRAGHDPGGEASVLNQVAWTYILMGEHDRALERCERGIALYHEIGEAYGEASTRDTLGYALHQLGRYEAAVGCFEASAALFREIGDRYLEADVLRHLGASCRALGDLGAARAAWRGALALLEEVAHPEADDMRASLRALDAGG